MSKSCSAEWRHKRWIKCQCGKRMVPCLLGPDRTRMGYGCNTCGKTINANHKHYVFNDGGNKDLFPLRIYTQKPTDDEWLEQHKKESRHP